MRILIDIGHPAHVHLFKNFAWQMQKKGHDILFTCREKEYEVYLLKTYGFKFESFGKKYVSKVGKFWGMFKFDLLEFIHGLKFKPDIFFSAGSIYASHASFLLRKPSIALEDTGNMEQVRLYKPFTTHILTSMAFHKDLGKKQIRYNSYHELAYLHPTYFKADSGIFKELGLEEGEKFSVVRFIAWNASHDYDIKKMSTETKIKIVHALEKYSKVYISSESDLPEELDSYRLSVNPERIHHVLAFANLLFAESGTMTSECAALGTPAIQISGLPEGTMGVLKEQEDYGLIKVFENYSDDVLDLAISWLKNNRKENISSLHARMINEKIDLTKYLIDFIEGNNHKKRK